MVEHKEWFSCEDANAVAIFSVNNVESDELVCIPVKPFFKTRGRKPAAEKSPYAKNERDFRHNNIIISKTEAVNVP